MYIKYQTNQVVNVKLQTVWYVFETENKKYTKNLAHKIQTWIANNVNPEIEYIDTEIFMDVMTGKYNFLEHIEAIDSYRLASDNGVATNQAELVQIVPIDALDNDKWYLGLTHDEVLSVLSKHAHNAVALYKQDDRDRSHKHYKKVEVLAEKVIPYLSELKAFYSPNQHEYPKYEKLLNDVKLIVSGMKKDIAIEATQN